MKIQLNNIFVYSIGVAFIVCFFSCSKTNKQELFQQNLQEIDALVQEDTSAARSRLQRLRNSALFPVQYLSIAKRELQLKIPVEALQTLHLGLKKHPDDSVLLAAISHILLQENKIGDALTYAPLLKDSPYAGVAAEIFIRKDQNDNTHQTPVSFWKEGFKLTKEHQFLENAAVLLAGEGKLVEASALRSVIPKTEALRSPYFWSCLAYDIGNFKPVIEDLFYSLVYADMTGLPENDPLPFEYARRHLLLAADASAGSKDMEQARGFWQEYVDRYPNAASDIFYNLSMTSPTEEEKISALINCIRNDPGYYPAVAQYVRAWKEMRSRQSAPNTLTEFLQSKDFYSLEMEKNYFLSSTFTLSAEEVLKNAMAFHADDPRLMLELFRSRYADAADYRQGNGEMWKILETAPDVPLIQSYARWYFARFGDYNACFTIEKTKNPYEDSFYDGLRYAFDGYSSKALAAFSEAEKDERYTCNALVNKGYIYDGRGEGELAIGCFTQAAALTENMPLKSKMLYEAARLYAKRNGEQEARILVKEALAADPTNHRAATLQRRLQNML